MQLTSSAPAYPAVARSSFTKPCMIYKEGKFKLLLLFPIPSCHLSPPLYSFGICQVFLSNLLINAVHLLVIFPIKLSATERIQCQDKIQRRSMQLVLYPLTTNILPAAPIPYPSLGLKTDSWLSDTMQIHISLFHKEVVEKWQFSLFGRIEPSLQNSATTCRKALTGWRDAVIEVKTNSSTPHFWSGPYFHCHMPYACI